MLKDFKEFAMKGNVVDLAVGVIIGGAFGKIVTSLVNDIIMPVLGLILGRINFSDLNYAWKDASGNVILTLKYGSFIQAAIDFLIIAFSLFIIIKAMNKFNKKKEEKPVPKAPSKEEQLLSEIRDILKEKQ